MTFGDAVFWLLIDAGGPLFALGAIGILLVWAGARGLARAKDDVA